jgi:hypothetical protein
MNTWEQFGDLGSSTGRGAGGNGHRAADNGRQSFEFDFRAVTLETWREWFRAHGRELIAEDNEPLSFRLDPADCPFAKTCHSTQTKPGDCVFRLGDEKSDEPKKKHPKLICLHNHTACKEPEHGNHDLEALARMWGTPRGARRVAASDDRARPRFEVFSLGPGRDLDALKNIRSRRHLVQGVLPTDSVVLFCAFTNVGKTVLVLDLILHYACDLPWHGQAIHPGGDVVWIAGEGLQNVRDLVEGWFEKHPDAQMVRRFHLISPGLAIPDEAEREALIGEIRTALAGHDLGALVVETMNKNFGPGDPDDTGDMTRFMEGCDALRDAFPGSVVCVSCHTGWAERDRPRGSSVSPSDCETVWSLTAPAEGRVQMSPFKSKGGAMLPRLFRVVPYESRRVEVNEDGQEQQTTFTYALLEPEEGGAGAAPGGYTGRANKLTTNQRAVFDAVAGTHPEWTQRADIERAAGLAGSSLTNALNALVARGLIEHNGGNTQASAYKLTEAGVEAHPTTRWANFNGL